MHGIPGGSSGKEPICQCRRCKRLGFNPWVWKIPWRRKRQTTPVFLPGETHRQRSLVGYSPQVTKSQTWPKQLSTSTYKPCRSTSLLLYNLKARVFAWSKDILPITTNHNSIYWTLTGLKDTGSWDVKHICTTLALSSKRAQPLPIQLQSCILYTKLHMRVSELFKGLELIHWFPSSVLGWGDDITWVQTYEEGLFHTQKR